MFEVGGIYENRKGTYEVLSIAEPKMKVRFHDGTIAELNINIQARIWENIVAENESKSGRFGRHHAQSAGATANFYIRTVDALVAEELAERGRKEWAVAEEVQKRSIGVGDRLVYFAVDSQVFFAVATITGEPTEPTKRDLTLEGPRDEPYLLFPIDVDVHAVDLENALAADSVEFENLSAIKNSLNEEGLFVPISEDDFEVLVDLLTELTEEEEDEIEDEDDEEDFDD